MPVTDAELSSLAGSPNVIDLAMRADAVRLEKHDCPG